MHIEKSLEKKFKFHYDSVDDHPLKSSNLAHGMLDLQITSKIIIYFGSNPYEF